MQVIQYVQFLHEKVQKYEGSYQPWGSEPTKLMPWVINSQFVTKICPQQLLSSLGTCSLYLFQYKL